MDPTNPAAPAAAASPMQEAQEEKVDAPSEATPMQEILAVASEAGAAAGAAAGASAAEQLLKRTRMAPPVPVQELKNFAMACTRMAPPVPVQELKNFAMACIRIEHFRLNPTDVLRFEPTDAGKFTPLDLIGWNHTDDAAKRAYGDEMCNLALLNRDAIAGDDALAGAVWRAMCYFNVNVTVQQAFVDIVGPGRLRLLHKSNLKMGRLIDNRGNKWELILPARSGRREQELKDYTMVCDRFDHFQLHPGDVMKRSPDGYCPLTVVGWRFTGPEAAKFTYGRALCGLVIEKLGPYMNFATEADADCDELYRALLFFGAEERMQHHFVEMVGEEAVRACKARRPTAVDNRAVRIF